MLSIHFYFEKKKIRRYRLRVVYAKDSLNGFMA